MKILRQALRRIENGKCRSVSRIEEERKWSRFFGNPSSWKDNRKTKCFPDDPDFLHPVTGEALWIESCFAPSWASLRLKFLEPAVGQVVKMTENSNGSEKGKRAESTNEAIRIYNKVRENGATPTISCFVAAVRACRDSRDCQLGREIHAHADETGNGSNDNLLKSLLDMYVKCGRMVEAQRIFDRVASHDVVSWTALITGYVHSREFVTALKLFSRMSDEGCAPNGRTFVMALKACTSLALKEERKHYEPRAWKNMCLEKGVAIHLQLKKSGCECDAFVGSALVDMYAKCGNMIEAQRVFDEMQLQDSVVSWTALILGYAQSGESELALQLFVSMQEIQGVTPGAQTYVAALKACTGFLVGKQSYDVKVQEMVLEKGVAIHSQLKNSGHESNLIVASSLVDLYAKCGRMGEARRIFGMISQRDVVSWNTIIMGSAQCGEEELALQLFAEMQDEGFRPNGRTFIAAIYACGGLATKEEGKIVDGKLIKTACLEKGLAIHSQLKNSGHELEIFVASTLVDMYAKCGSLVDSRRVFDRMSHHDVISWTAIIMGYAQTGEGELALQYFERMQERGFTPEARAFIAALKACVSQAVREDSEQARTRYLEKGRALHQQLAKLGYEIDKFVASSLVDMYAKCGSIGEARRVFERMQQPDVVAWNSIIVGSVQNGDNEVALELIRRMQERGFEPNSVTFVAGLKACSNQVALEAGRRLHYKIRHSGLEREIFVANSLIGFYSRVGSMTSAQQVFDFVEKKDSVTWTALITGYSNQGATQQVFDHFESMQNERLQPDPITFLSVLTACSHAGLVDKGKEYFQAMCSDYVMLPSVEHYTCMVDLLARANHLNDAVAMVKSMPYEPTSKVWLTVLSACRKWKNVDVGKLAFDSMVRLDRGNSSAYVLMSNIYILAGMVDECGKIQEMSREVGRQMTIHN